MFADAALQLLIPQPWSAVPGCQTAEGLSCGVHAGLPAAAGAGGPRRGAQRGTRDVPGGPPEGRGGTRPPRDADAQRPRPACREHRALNTVQMTPLDIGPHGQYISGVWVW